jgi:hypothetical protein
MLKCFAYSASLVWGEVHEQVKCNIAPVLAMKTYRGDRGIALFILDLSGRWTWVVTFIPWLFPGTRWGRGWVVRRAGLDILAEKKKSVAFLRNRTPDRPPDSLVTTAELVRWLLKTAGRDDVMETEAHREQEVQDACTVLRSKWLDGWNDAIQ